MKYDYTCILIFLDLLLIIYYGLSFLPSRHLIMVHFIIHKYNNATLNLIFLIFPPKLPSSYHVRVLNLPLKPKTLGPTYSVERRNQEEIFREAHLHLQSLG